MTQDRLERLRNENLVLREALERFVEILEPARERLLEDNLELYDILNNAELVLKVKSESRPLNKRKKYATRTATKLSKQEVYFIRDFKGTVEQLVEQFESKFNRHVSEWSINKVLDGSSYSEY
jgi:hypothetical protein